MIKKAAYISFLTAALLTAVAGRGYAFGLYDLICIPAPGCPEPDFIDEGVSIMKSGLALKTEVEKVTKSAEDILNKVKTFAKATLSGDLSPLNNALNPGQKPMENCVYLGKNFKNTDSDDVYMITKILFLQYPGKSQAEIEKYDSYRQNWYKDSLLEIYTASQEMQVDLENRIDVNIADAIACLKGEKTEGCGFDGGEPEGSADAQHIEGKALQALDNVYEMMLKITALRAQYEALKVINSIPAAPYMAELKEQVADSTTSTDTSETSESEAATPAQAPAEQRQSALETGRIYAQASVKYSAQLAFADSLGSQTRSVTSALSDVEAASALPQDSAQKLVNDAFLFAVAPVSEEVHAYVYEEEKMAELDKIEPIESLVATTRELHNQISGLDSYKKLAESVQEARERYENALKTLEMADQCARAYIGRHFKNANQVWGGGNVTDNDARTGISAWAMQAYEAAKAAETNDADSSNVPHPNVDPQNEDLADAVGSTNSNKVYKSISASVGSAKDDETTEEFRKTRMLPWQIGAEAAKLLAADPAKWGTSADKRAFPIWQDVKSFYHQYISKKYANIKAYLRSYTRADVLAVIADRLQGGNSAIAATLQKKKADIINKKLSQEMNGLTDSEDKASAEYQGEYKSGLAALEAKRDNIKKQLEQKSAQYKESADKLADARAKADSDAGDEMLAEVEANDPYPETLDEMVPSGRGVMPIEKNDAVEKNFHDKIAANKEAAQLDTLEKEVEKYKKEKADLQKDLANVEKQIAAYRRLKQGGLSRVQELVEEAKAKKQALADKAADAISEENINFEADVEKVLRPLVVQKTANRASPLNADVYESLVSAAGKALEDVYAMVDARIDAAVAELEILGDDLYDASYHSQVVAIHQRMIDQIKGLALTVSVADLGTFSGIRLYAELASADTAAESEDYFVGNPAQKRDLKAPKAVLTQNLPPLREMFHFDEHDFQAVKPVEEGQTETSPIMSDEFLKYGGEIPEIWNYMLRPHSFVETDFDLKEALTEGCTASAFIRGGYMPCMVGSTPVDLTEDGLFVVAQNIKDLSRLHACPGLEPISGGVHHTAYDIDIKFGTDREGILALLDASKNNDKEQPDIDCAYSELGTLLEVNDKGELQFRQKAYDVYYNLIVTKNSDKELSDKQKRKMAAFERAAYGSNQIGDFLFYAENVQSLRGQLEEMEEQYKKALDELFEILRGYGFEPSENLDLSKESDYNLVRSRLDGIKNANIADALELIKDVKIEDNPVVQERVDTLRGVIAAMEKDRDEVTNIGLGADEQNDLDEEIKTAKVNRQATDKYQKSLKDKAKEAFGQEEYPYCAVY